MINIYIYTAVASIVLLWISFIWSSKNWFNQLFKMAFFLLAMNGVYLVMRHLVAVA